MNLVSKEKFVEIVNRLKQTDETVDTINEIFNNTIDSKTSDFMNAASLMICHEDIVVELLKIMFNDKDTITWWLYELDYGKQYTDGCITELDGTIIDLSTPEKLYDYLIDNMERIG